MVKAGRGTELGPFSATEKLVCWTGRSSTSKAKALAEPRLKLFLLLFILAAVISADATALEEPIFEVIGGDSQSEDDPLQGRSLAAQVQDLLTPLVRKLKTAEKEDDESFQSSEMAAPDSEVIAPDPAVAAPEAAVEAPDDPEVEAPEPAVAAPDTEHNNTERYLLGQCDLTKGRWEFDSHRPRYSSSCPYIRSSFNCQRNGRKDQDYMKYKWTPDNCDLPTFDAYSFVKLLRNKRVAFVGDSITRNMQQSLACLLDADSRTPVKHISTSINGVTCVGIEVRKFNFQMFVFVSPFIAWYSSRQHDFKQSGVPYKDSISQFLVNTDIMDPNWAAPFPFMDVTIFTSGRWFTNRQGSTSVRAVHYLRNGRHEPDITGQQAYRRVLKNLDTYVRQGVRYRGVPFFLSSFPAHYSRDGCDNTKPLSKDDAKSFYRGFSWPSIEKDVFASGSSRFRLIDIAWMTSFRADAHLNRYFGSRGNTGPNALVKVDCLHLCLPGLPDAWNDILLYTLINTMMSRNQAAATEVVLRVRRSRHFRKRQSVRRRSRQARHRKTKKDKKKKKKVKKTKPRPRRAE